MKDHTPIRVMRNMAWERAKGELNSMLQTFYDDIDNSSLGQFKELSKAVTKFIEKVEDDGLQE